MTIDEVKVLLKSLAKAKAVCRAREWQYKSCRKNLESLKACDYSAPRISGGNIAVSSVEQAILRMEQYKERYQTACTKLFAIEDKIEILLPLLDDTEQALVIDRFMNDVPMFRLYEKYYYTFDGLKDKYKKIYIKIAQKSP